VTPPPTSERLRERNLVDRRQEIEEAARRSPSERLQQTLEISELVRRLAGATGARRRSEGLGRLEEKARLLARPLRLLRSR